MSTWRKFEASRLQGKDLATNLAFHYGRTGSGRTVNARPTAVIVPYLTAMGELAQEPKSRR